ncbi:MAG TPA: sulfurtransferase [Acidimicrobiia bacterium]|jgi:thiosulfate/3-mercaptopyruvate sulfurtransferase|nr:sulfurtransferase [Acidimicrobiia bacterium]
MPSRNDYANPTALVTTEWLAENLDDPALRIIEVDEDTDAYGRGHIRGAIAWNWSTDLHHPLQRDYLDQEGLTGLLARSGVDADTTVVLYGGNNNWFAAYAYWLLKLRGFDKVKLLDGGRLKWNVEQRETTTEVPVVRQTDYRIQGQERPDFRALRDDVLSRVGAGGTTFVDVRSPEEFSGEKLAPDHLPQEQPYVGGHVPGARNIPWSKAANEDGSFRSAPELSELYSSVNGEPVVTYCRIGERSAHTWFVLHELLGLENVANYDGSWTEYGSLVGAPVER